MSNLAKYLRDARVTLCGVGALFLVGEGLVSPTHANGLYQNLDGTYPSLSDFVRDIEGTPCGIECTARAEARWAQERHHAKKSATPRASQYFGYYPR